MKSRPFRMAALAPAVVALSLMADPAAAQARCKSTAIGMGKAVSVRDGRTLILADGREVRLAGIEVTDSSRAALHRLVSGRPIRLERLNGEPESNLGADHDRYGRLVAFAFLNDAPKSVQQALLEAGQARVSARVGAKTCAEALLSAEREARAAGRGLWADPNFAPLQAENLKKLQSARGHFALVEGKVLLVRESGATIYVNFGRRWTRDFTVTVLKRRQRKFAAAGIELKRLEGRRIRVRGWIEQRNGPIVAAALPEQIELVD